MEPGTFELMRSWKVWYLGFPDPSKAEATVTITNPISIYWPLTVWATRGINSVQLSNPQTDREHPVCTPRPDTLSSTALWGGPQGPWGAEIGREHVSFGPHDYFNQNTTFDL